MSTVCWRTAMRASSSRRAWSSGGAGVVDMVVLRRQQSEGAARRGGRGDDKSMSVGNGCAGALYTSIAGASRMRSASGSAAAARTEWSRGFRLGLQATRFRGTKILRCCLVAQTGSSPARAPLHGTFPWNPCSRNANARPTLGQASQARPWPQATHARETTLRQPYARAMCPAIGDAIVTGARGRKYRTTSGGPGNNSMYISINIQRPALLANGNGIALDVSLVSPSACH